MPTDNSPSRIAAKSFATATPEESDLGFGRVAAQAVRGRFLSPDGHSTARKLGLKGQRTEQLYLRALSMPWPSFLLWLVSGVLLLNGIFALGYRSLGAGALLGTDSLGIDDPFMQAFAYSVGIFTTTGTDGVHAVGATAHALTITQSMLGPLIGMITLALIVARLTRPRAAIRFSESAVIAPYEDGRALMFRIVNELPSELTEVTASVSITWFENIEGQRERNFHQLRLERNNVTFFPLHWTIVHPIDERSPLRGVTPERLRRGEAEILILISAHEETFFTQVSVRHSYAWDEVTWDAKFTNIFINSIDDALAIDIERLSRFDRLPENSTRVPPEHEGAARP
ncbi:transporter [Gemmatimonas sp.]|uniref:transporter n=1 Tax=Gemmatimonas sp. TaxID=1962908 RepID=UPI003340334F